MPLKMVFHLSKDRALKMRRLAEYQAAEEKRGTDTELTLNQLIDWAYQAMQDEKRAKLQLKLQPRQMSQTEKLVEDLCQRPRGDRVILTGAGDVFGVAAQVRARRPDLELVIR
jgi:hypothetical protein